jgi:UDP-N-acetylglucosamine--N-acetylmuramyl-(pentapeptide) pyrophosphoryl-undecaprenol N-acetylglucosamine transferase
MPLALQAADLVVCRAGASTLSELALLGKPSVLIPLPAEIGSSPQEVNAAAFAQKQAAEIIRNVDLKPEMLVLRIKDIITSTMRLQHMSKAVREFAKPEATKTIVETVVQMAQGAVTRTSKREVISI